MLKIQRQSGAKFGEDRQPNFAPGKAQTKSIQIDRKQFFGLPAFLHNRPNPKFSGVRENSEFYLLPAYLCLPAQLPNGIPPAGGGVTGSTISLARSGFICSSLVFASRAVCDIGTGLSFASLASLAGLARL